MRTNQPTLLKITAMFVAIPRYVGLMLFLSGFVFEGCGPGDGNQFSRRSGGLKMPSNLLSCSGFITHSLNYIYIIVEDEQTFQSLPGEEGSFNDCRYKSGVWNGVEITFQFWKNRPVRRKENDHEQRG